MQPLTDKQLLSNAFEGVAKRKKATIGDFITNGSYAIMRKCPNAHSAMGHKNLWDMKVTQFHYLLEHISEEFKPDKKK